MDRLLGEGVWNAKVIFRDIQALGYPGAPKGQCTNHHQRALQVPLAWAVFRLNTCVARLRSRKPHRSPCARCWARGWTGAAIGLDCWEASVR